MSKTKTKSYTLSELAKIAEVTPSSMSDFLRKHNLKPFKTGQYNRKYYDSSVYDIVIRHYKDKAKTETKTKSTTKDDIIAELRARLADKDKTIALLKDQLAIKDAQIADNAKMIATVSKLADQAQQLDLTTHNQQLTEPVSDKKDSKSKTKAIKELKKQNEELKIQVDDLKQRGFWQRLFNK